MKRMSMFIPSVFLFFFTFGCQQGEKVVGESVDVEADVQAIKGIIAEWNTAGNAGDIDRSLSHRAENEIQIPPNQPAIVGKEADRRLHQQWFDQFIFNEDDVVKDVRVSGDLAVAHVIWSAIVTPKVGGEPVNSNGNAIIVLKKQSDDVWNCIYWIWSDESLIDPSQKQGA